MRAPIRRVETRRLSHAYPVYTRDYESRQATLDDWLGKIDGLLTFGRQGLLRTTTRTMPLATAYAAADCLGQDASSIGRGGPITDESSKPTLSKTELDPEPAEK